MKRRRLAAGVGLLVCAVVGVTLVGVVPASAATVISTPAAPGGWNNDGAPEVSPTYVAGPAGADGTGSLKFSTPTTNDHVNYFHLVNTPLLGVHGLSYMMNNTGGPQASYQLVICAGGLATDGSCLQFTTLVSEPYQNGGTLAGDGTWHTFGNLGTGMFWSTRSIPGNAGSSSNQILTHLSAITHMNPNATVIAYGVSQGSSNPGSISYVDDVAFNGTTTNFEFAAPPVITTNPDLTVYQTTPAGTPVPFTVPTATDPNTGLPVAVGCIPGSNSVFPVGTTTVTCTATEPEGLSATSTFTIQVIAISTACQGLPLDDKGYLQAHPDYAANGGITPCVASTYQSIGVGPIVLIPGIPLLHILPTGLNVSVLHGVTDLAASPGLVQTSANSTLAAVAVSAPGLTLEAHGLYSQASATLSGGLCNNEITTGLSTIAALRINGKDIVIGTAPITINLGVIKIYVNQTVRSGSTITQRALYIDLLSHSTWITVGQSVAGVACHIVT